MPRRGYPTSDPSRCGSCIRNKRDAAWWAAHRAGVVRCAKCRRFSAEAELAPPRPTTDRRWCLACDAAEHARLVAQARHATAVCERRREGLHAVTGTRMPPAEPDTTAHRPDVNYAALAARLLAAAPFRDAQAREAGTLAVTKELAARHSGTYDRAWDTRDTPAQRQWRAWAVRFLEATPYTLPAPRRVA